MADGGIGEAALLSDLLPAGAANGIPMLGDIVGTGLLGDAGGVSSLLGSGTSLLPSAMTGVPAGVESLVPALQSAAPEAAGQVANALGSADKAALLNNSGYAGYGGSLDKASMLSDAGYGAPATADATLSPYELAQRDALYGKGYGDTAGMTQSMPEKPGLVDQAVEWAKKNPFSAASMGMNALSMLNKSNSTVPTAAKYSGPLSRFKYDPSVYAPAIPAQPTPYRPQYAGGGPVEAMANQNAIGQNTGYPQANIHQGAYATPWQMPISENVLSGSADTNVDPYTGEERFAGGGIASLGAYSDGGQMLKGPGDGMSDSIPATIAGKQPARLANDEFVVPADVVSHLGNGSSDAGAKQLYKMMDKVRLARTGSRSQGKQINPNKYMPT